MMLVVALGSLGVGYANWSQTLTVNNNVSTGIYDVIFNGFTPPGSSNNATFSATQDGTHKYDISLSNLYPGLDADFTFVLKNTGSIPAKISAIKIDSTNYTAPVSKNLTSSPPDATNDITITVSSISTSTTIAASANITGHLVVHTWKIGSNGNTNDATPSASGNFTFEIDTAQSVP